MRGFGGTEVELSQTEFVIDWRWVSSVADSGKNGKW